VAAYIANPPLPSPPPPFQLATREVYRCVNYLQAGIRAARAPGSTALPPKTLTVTLRTAPAPPGEATGPPPPPPWGQRLLLLRRDTTTASSSVVLWTPIACGPSSYTTKGLGLGHLTPQTLPDP